MQPLLDAPGRGQLRADVDQPQERIAHLVLEQVHDVATERVVLADAHRRDPHALAVGIGRPRREPAGIQRRAVLSFVDDGADPRDVLALPDEG